MIYGTTPLNMLRTYICFFWQLVCRRVRAMCPFVQNFAPVVWHCSYARYCRAEVSASHFTLINKGRMISAQLRARVSRGHQHPPKHGRKQFDNSLYERQIADLQVAPVN
eukprot:6194075-Pleurochrysis_carterae.AAC.2